MGNNCCLYASTEDLSAKQVKENSIEERKLNQPTELPHISDREGIEILQAGYLLNLLSCYVNVLTSTATHAEVFFITHVFFKYCIMQLVFLSALKDESSSVLCIGSLGTTAPVFK